jgi:hypothetical protein
MNIYIFFFNFESDIYFNLKHFNIKKIYNYIF